MSQIIDRRPNGKNKSAVNRRRFIERYKGQIKKAVTDAIAGRSIKDVEGGEKINIPGKDISEPHFHHGNGGEREVVHTGNKEFTAGDKIQRPNRQSGQGKGGSKPSNQGEGTDDFVFELSKEEFMEFFFEDLELPNLVRKTLASTVEKRRVRAGFTSDGMPSNINIVRSFRGALGRRIALATPKNKRLFEAEEELEQRLKSHGEEDPLVLELREEIRALKSKLRAVPFIDPIDLRYNNRVEIPRPTTKAVMFCLMDVSGSMDQSKKDMAKRFFILLYLFLTRSYEKIDLVFICHHTVAREVTEDEFFYSRETGGTVVSSALQLMLKIVGERYSNSEWNIYAAQASDGDNWHDDSPMCRDILNNAIMPLVQYYAYVEITPENHQSLWFEYEKVQAAHPHFAMQQIESPGDIYPVFQELFKKQVTS